MTGAQAKAYLASIGLDPYEEVWGTLQGPEGWCRAQRWCWYTTR